MILLISLYVDMNVPRCQEFMECVRRNAANPCIDQLHVFVEMPPNSHLAGLLSSFPQLGLSTRRYPRRTPQNSGYIAFTMSLMSERNAVG